MLHQAITAQKPRLSSLYSSANIDTRIIRANDARAYELLSDAYKKLFLKFFGNEEYQEPLEKWFRRLEDKDAPSNYIIGISGLNLDNPEKRELAGMHVGIYYKNAQTGLLAYNIVDDAWRGTGLGRMQVDMRKKLLVDAANKNGTPLRGIFAECNDPAIVPASQDIINPAKRLEMYARMGGKRVPIDYICPSGSDLGDKLGDMMLLAFPHPQTGAYPTREDTTAYLKGCYIVRGLTPEGDVSFEHMQRQLGAITPNKKGEWLLPLVDNSGAYKPRKTSLRAKPI